MTQVPARVGMQVMVDMAGFNAGGVSMGSGVSMSGTIVAINTFAGEITVQLHGAVGGVTTVVVPPQRLSASGS